MSNETRALKGSDCESCSRLQDEKKDVECHQKYELLCDFEKFITIINELTLYGRTWTFGNDIFVFGRLSRRMTYEQQEISKISCFILIKQLVCNSALFVEGFVCWELSTNMC